MKSDLSLEEIGVADSQDANILKCKHLKSKILLHVRHLVLVWFLVVGTAVLKSSVAASLCVYSY